MPLNCVLEFEDDDEGGEVGPFTFALSPFTYCGLIPDP